MVHLICDIYKGLRESEAIAAMHDVHGRQHFIRVERDFLTERDGKHYLPVWIVHVDARSRAILVEFPHEAETGTHRIWVYPASLLEPIEAPT